jgi:pimeloyl-ACP methyl ester carboxylesterase
LSVWLASAWLLAAAPEPVHVSFRTEDGGIVFADAYGTGARGLVLAHGARFDKESWAKQARAFAEAGYRVLAIDFRGYGQSHGPGDEDPMSAPLHNDVLAAVRYLRASGAKTVAIVGGSMGGNAAADASARAIPGEIQALVVLGSRAGRSPEKIPCRTLVIASKEDADGSGTLRLPNIQASYEKMTAPKEILIFDGSAHAQFLFQTDEGARVMREILRFLGASQEVPCCSTAPTRSFTAQRRRPTALSCATS